MDAELFHKIPAAQGPSRALFLAGAALGKRPGRQGAAMGLGELELPGG